MDVDLLSEYQLILNEASEFHLGYPYNLKHDHTFLLPFLKYSINNLGGDCFTKSHYRIDSRDFEKEVLQFFANLYHLQDWWGYVTTSGTEGNLYGILLGRENYPNAILYASDASHYSVSKAARFFRIPYQKIGVQTPSEEMDYSDFYKQLVPNLPAIICLNLGTTFTGAIDDIEQILNVLEMKQVSQFYIHVDGALGGMLLPYLRSHWIDFNRPISSLSISGHKFIGSPFPCGIVITKKHLVEALTSDIEYIGAQDMTIGGSRNGHTSLCLWHEISKRRSNFGLEVTDCVAKAGLVFPIGIIGIDALIRRVNFPPFHLSWWRRHYRTRSSVIIKDSVILQVSILIILICSAVTTGWLFGAKLNTATKATDENLFVVLLMTAAFIGVAIACWTTLPQVVAIAEAREAAEHLFTVAQDGILVLDEQGSIRQANPATESIFDIKPFELLGNHLSKWIFGFPDYPQQWAKRSEHTLFHKAGVQTLEISVSDRPHQDFQEYVVILHDITKRKQAEERLRQSQAQLQQEAKLLASQLVQSEKMSSLGQLVAGVAHEINNPVNFIYGNLTPANQYTQDLLELLQLYQQYYPNPVAQIQKQAQAIDIDFLIEDLPKLLASMRIGAERITEIVQSLRNFSRLDQAEMKAVNIHEGIDSTLMLLEHRLKATANYPAIKLIKEYSNLPLIECYPGQLNQVFMNILANAIDALEESIADEKTTNIPQICICTSFIPDQQLVIISIADNGCGIPENIQKQLFDPFFTTKPVGKGTGLGLSISYQIITQKHKGTLECISSPNKGTEFIITIPLKHS